MRSERGREVRARLLAAAVELVPDVGWERVSTRMLAEQAGVATGVVHYHFASVDELLRQATMGVAADLVAALRATLSEDLPLEDGLARMLGFLDPYSGSDRTSLLFLEAYLAATRDLELRRRFAELVADFKRELARWLAARGVPDPEASAAMLAATIDGLVMHRTLDPGLGAAAVLPVVRRMLGVGAQTSPA